MKENDLNNLINKMECQVEDLISAKSYGLIQGRNQDNILGGEI